MHLVPTQEEVIELLRKTGGLRPGHFEYSSGRHVDEYLQVPLSMRHYQEAKILSVGLSRQLRAHLAWRESCAVHVDVQIACEVAGVLFVR